MWTIRLKYLFVLTFPLSVIVSLTGGFASWVTVIYVFIALPLAELLLPALADNHTQEIEDQIVKDRWFDVLAWAMVPLQYSLLYLFLQKVSKNTLGPWELLGMISAMGTSCGILGINVGHELGHRKNRFEQGLALILLLSSQYMHFFIEHNRGHHKHVSTPLDPASARQGESLYRFLPRSITGSWRSSVHIDKQLTLTFLAIQLVFVFAIGFIWGIQGGIAYLLAAAIGVLQLETVNYIEHYGLTRDYNPKTCRYQKVFPTHSWNSNHLLGRLALFELSRHSDHHANAHRKYQILKHHDDSPQMPTGYPGMLVLATVPPLWFKVMHRALATWKQQDGRIN